MGGGLMGGGLVGGIDGGAGEPVTVDPHASMLTTWLAAGGREALISGEVHPSEIVACYEETSSSGEFFACLMDLLLSS